MICHLPLKRANLWILGPNGAGKSTTMNIMTGYIGASSGEVIINGHNILEEPEKAKMYRISSRDPTFIS